MNESKKASTQSDFCELFCSGTISIRRVDQVKKLSQLASASIIIKSHPFTCCEISNSLVKRIDIDLILDCMHYNGTLTRNVNYYFLCKILSLNEIK